MRVQQSQRPRFYEEQYLGAADLTAAVDYSRVQQARHALGAHTWGIAIGLQLQETPQAGGAVSVHLLPGYAWDGYGRPIVVLSPYKIPEEKFSGIKFDPSLDTDGQGRLIPVWLRYDESATQPPRPGFELCETADQYARIQETFRIEIGDQPGTTDRYAGVTVAAKSLTDAKTALQAFDPTAPLVYDESIPQQTFPEPQDRARWLIPIGYVRWLPVQNQPGHFVARDDGGANKDSDKIRRFRRYVGVVTEEIAAADGAIRLRHRGQDPANSFFQWPTKEQMTNGTNDLVWIEGKLRVVGNAKLCGGKLDFRDQQGQDHNAPLRIQRSEDAVHGVSVLQATIGPEGTKNHRFAVGPLKVMGNTEIVEEKFVVLNNGNVGVGTSAPSHKLHVDGATGIRQNRLYLSGGDGWSSVTYNAFHNDANGAWVFPDPTHKVMTIELDDINGIPRFEVFSNQDANASGWRSRLKVAGDTGNVLMAYQGGNVGIGTTNPTHKFHVLAQEAVGLFESTTATQAFLRLATSEGLNNRVEITNRQGGRLSLFTSGAGDAFNITRDGNVGIGTIAPLTKLHVLGNRIRLENSNKRVDIRADGSSVDLHSETNDLYVRSSGPGGNNNVIVNPYPEDGKVGIGTVAPSDKLHVIGDLRLSGVARKPGGGSWTDSSDMRLKQSVEPLSDALRLLLQLRGVRFEWNEPEKMGNLTGRQMGLIAQEVEEVFPEWVSTSPEGYKELTIRGFEALTIEALRELRGEVEALRTRLEAAVGKQPVTSTRPRRKRGDKETKP